MTSTRWYGIFLLFCTVFIFSGSASQAAISTLPGEQRSGEQELQALFEESIDFLINASDRMEKKGEAVLIAIVPLETSEMFDETEGHVGIPDFLRKYLPSPRRIVEEAAGADNPDRVNVTYDLREHQTGGPNSPNRGFAMMTKPANVFKMMPPLQTMVISSRYGWRHNRPHQGTDFAAPMGADILAVESGKVTYAGWNSSGYGNLVTIDHGNNMKSRYAHCSKVLVHTNQTVRKGQVIAKVGSTGRSTGPHLHFEVLVNGVHQNPEHYLFR